MLPFRNFNLLKIREGVLQISFEYTHVTNGFDNVLVLVVEEDGRKDTWDLRTREYTISTPSGPINSTRLSFFNVTYNDWLTIPSYTEGDRDDHGRRLFFHPIERPLRAGTVTINAYYDPSQVDAERNLEFYVCIAIVSTANSHPVAKLGDFFVSSTITV